MIAIAGICTFSSSAKALEPTEAAAIFGKRCTACHTYGKGIRVGPDLKGVTGRRKHDWLLKFIHSSQTVIQSGDPVAVALFQQFKQQRMPDWTDLTPQQINALLDYFAAGGPEQKAIDERNAATATSFEIEQGRQLFHGQVHFANGGQACSSCHGVRDRQSLSGGNLGPDLTTIYLSYQDEALTTFLRHPCTPRAPEIDRAEFLTPVESFSLKAYLRQLAITHNNSTSQSVADAHASAKKVSP